MSGPCKYLAVCKASAVAPGKVIKIEKEGLTLAVFNVGGEYFVTNDACTHGPGSLSEGEVDGDIVARMVASACPAISPRACGASAGSACASSSRRAT